jgi:hypothetical protein
LLAGAAVLSHPFVFICFKESFIENFLYVIHWDSRKEELSPFVIG